MIAAFQVRCRLVITGKTYAIQEISMDFKKNNLSSNDRRHFLKTAFLHVAAVGTSATAMGEAQVAESVVQSKNPFSSDPLAIRKLTDRVSTTRLGFGTGMNGGNELRALEEEEGIALLRYSYDRGVRFFDMADTYKTHQLVGKALRDKDRSEYTLTSKMWLHKEVEKPLDEQIPAREFVTRFLREYGTDYIDVLQIHCMMRPGWATLYQRYMDDLEELKEEGVILSHGVSCHSYEAAKEAVVHPWVDVIHFRFNPFGARMEGTVEENLELLKTAQKNGKGTIIMKVAGEGSFDSETVGESIKYVAKLETADTMVVGMNTREQVDFLIDKTAEALQEII